MTVVEGLGVLVWNMSRLLPDEQVTDVQDTGPEVVDLDETESETVSSVLSADTARSLVIHANRADFERPSTVPHQFSPRLLRVT